MDFNNLTGQCFPRDLDFYPAIPSPPSNSSIEEVVCMAFEELLESSGDPLSQMRRIGLSELYAAQVRMEL
ncbi:MAG TPA: hypothetical protein DCP91_00340 [Eggerthellaceae bacterium]|nr:hypothetical protein [Eggerthellaceae bacterium]